ncbi:MAG: methyltransferase domain-containing protein, partial [Rickettsiales bacterium]
DKFKNVLEINSKSSKISDLFKNNITITNEINYSPIEKYILCDIEHIHFEYNKFDLIINILDLHHVDRIEDTLLNIKNILLSGGKFIASLFTKSTLIELRDAIVNTQIRLDLPITPHIVPFITIEDITKIMSMLKFKDIIVDSYTIVMEYESVIALMYDLRAMGQTNVMNNRKYFRKDILSLIDKVYREKNSSTDDRIKASFNIATITAGK